MNGSKEALRTRYAGCAPPSTLAGKIAERIRRLDEYRKAGTIFMMPSPLLFQARINCLLDGKVLLMPSPALKLGFYKVKPFAIRFPDLAYGTSLKGITLFGQKVQAGKMKNMVIDLALTGCVALDPDGQRLGEGTGFFDLSMGLLGTMGSVTEKTTVGCVAGDLQLHQDDLVCNSWDIAVDFLVNDEREQFFSHSRKSPAVFWDVLGKKQIRKIDPLWLLYCEMHPNAPEESAEPQVESSPSPWEK